VWPFVRPDYIRTAALAQMQAAARSSPRPVPVGEERRRHVDGGLLAGVPNPRSETLNSQPTISLTDWWGIPLTYDALGEQGFFANLPWGKLMDEHFASGSGWLGGLVSRVRHDLEIYGTGEATIAYPTDWLITMILIWDDLPNLIVIALLLFFLG
jgi:hypothetical protein